MLRVSICSAAFTSVKVAVGPPVTTVAPGTLSTMAERMGPAMSAIA